MNKHCTACYHSKVCIFRTKLVTLVNNFRHLFNEGPYSVGNGFASVCRHFNESAVDFTLSTLEEQRIIQALAAAKDNRGEAAKLLGIGERTLYRKLHKYNLIE